MEGRTGELIRAWKGEVIENANPIPNGGMYIPPASPPCMAFFSTFLHLYNFAATIVCLLFASCMRLLACF